MFPIVCRFAKLKIVLLLTFVVSLAGCGGGDSNPIPVGGKVTMSQTEINWKLGNPGVCVEDANYNDHVVFITVTDSSDRPLGDVEVLMSVDLTGNTSPGVPVLKLYEDKNSNGVVDDPEEYVSGVGDPFFKTRTDKYSGTKMIILRVNLTCTYSGILNVFSGSAATGRLDVNVVPENS
jgi:hypothetical protein